MGDKGYYPIRDRIKQAPQIDTEPTQIDLTIGRKIVLQQMYGISENERRSHPLYEFADQVEEIHHDTVYGEAVAGIDLYLRIMSPELVEKIISHRTYSKRGEPKGRKKEGMYREIKKGIREEFRKGQSDESVFEPFFSRDLLPEDDEDLSDGTNLGYRPHIPRSFPLLGSDIEFIDTETMERSGYTYEERGPAYLQFSKRTKTNKLKGEVSIKPLLDDEHNQTVLLDDIERINNALKSVDLLKTDARGLVLNDLTIEIPVFRMTEQAVEDNIKPAMPRVPQGFIRVEPLAIWEG